MPHQSNHGRGNPPPPPKRQSSSGKAKSSRSKSNGRVGVGADGDVGGKGRSKSNDKEVTRSKTQSSTRTQEITTYNRRNTTSASSVGDRSRSRSKSKKQNNDNGASDADISRSRSKSKTKSKKSSKQQSITKSTTNKTTTSPSKAPRTSSTKKLQSQQPKLKKRDKKLFADNARKAIPSSIRMISGSHDTQTSADVSNISSQFQLPNPAGRSGGACTAALLNVLYHNHKYGSDTEDDRMSWVDVLRQMRTVLQDKGFTQIPQLTSSRMIDVQHDPFVITPEDGSFHPSRNTQRAVLIGINYTGQSSGQLSGCHNDVHNVAKYLMDVQGFKEKNVTILMDDGVHKSPTKSAILSAYKRLVKESKSGDVVFCHYSGHGGRLVDDNGDEEDGYDETLIPVVSCSNSECLHTSVCCFMRFSLHSNPCLGGNFA